MCFPCLLLYWLEGLASNCAFSALFLAAVTESYCVVVSVLNEIT